MMQEFKLPKIFNWQTASDKLVKKYVADLFQTGTDAPVATELFNNTGIAFTYEYLSTGVYLVNCSKPIFSGCSMGCPSGQKTQVAISNLYNEILPGGPYSACAYPVDASNIIILSAKDISAADDFLGFFTQNTIEITIYPQS